MKCWMSMTLLKSMDSGLFLFHFILFFVVFFLGATLGKSSNDGYFVIRQSFSFFMCFGFLRKNLKDPMIMTHVDRHFIIEEFILSLLSKISTFLLLQFVFSNLDISVVLGKILNEMNGYF